MTLASDCYDVTYCLVYRVLFGDCLAFGFASGGWIGPVFVDGRDS